MAGQEDGENARSESVTARCLMVLLLFVFEYKP